MHYQEDMPALLSILNTKVLGFELLKELYVEDSNFSNIYVACEGKAVGKFIKHEGFLFKLGKLCIPQGLTRELLI